MDRQLGRLTTYVTEQGWTIVAACHDVASGLNEKRRGLQQVLALVQRHAVDYVVVEFRDRLARFGSHYLETFLL
ncbi:MAG: hypothetical protein C7B45_11845 [Sulfobacillus acidophilus]|uniref:Resolvase/invertase-type recombinase catalytic domain-containing protein n=1 Tax=Sulfobacillus acidophilus TaxID=53633 RepID=A0A2T2WG20_9FIRM|nr:MAG: hypothetical protein C7B45_11845 [Sulfobacillus acidophilus]